MTDKDTKTNIVERHDNIDLNELADLNFGPSWADANAKTNNNSWLSKKTFNEGSHKNYSEDKKSKRDRRARVPQSNFRRKSDTKFNNDDTKSYPKFEPSFDIKIYPQDTTFDALVKRLKIIVKHINCLKSLA